MEPENDGFQEEPPFLKTSFSAIKMRWDYHGNIQWIQTYCSWFRHRTKAFKHVVYPTIYTVYIRFYLYRRWSLDNGVSAGWNTLFVCDSCSWSGQSFLSQNHRVIICHQLKQCTIIREIPQNYHIYCTWNPHDPCFDWNFDLLLEGSTPTTKDKHPPQRNE